MKQGGCSAIETGNKPLQRLVREYLLMIFSAHWMIPIFQTNETLWFFCQTDYLPGIGERDDRVGITVENQDIVDSFELVGDIELQ